MELKYQAIIKNVEELLNITVIQTSTPPQGMDGEVFLLKDSHGKEYAVKLSDNTNDVLAYQLLEKHQIAIPVPKLFGHFSFNNKTVLILEKINFPLLENIPISEQSLFIPSMLENLKKIHTITSDKAGLISEENKIRSWKELLLLRYSGTHPSFNWTNIVQRENVDRELIEQSVEKITVKITQQECLTTNYSLLHTDFNQRNLFMNPEKHEITSIIDWGESMFGDPLYDFARVRMYIWHFKLGKKTLQNYYTIVKLTPEEKQLEELYFVDQILHYIAWYSDIHDEFNKGRLQLHQEFLRAYTWK